MLLVFLISFVLLMTILIKPECILLPSHSIFVNILTNASLSHFSHIIRFYPFDNDAYVHLTDIYMQFDPK